MGRYDPMKFEIEVEIDPIRPYNKNKKRKFKVTKIKQKATRKRKTSKKK